MHEYDTVLKVLLQGSANSILEQITGVRVARWLNVELPRVRQTRVALLGESAHQEPDLIRIELQSTNDPQVPLRMAEYSLGVYRKFQRFPRQIVLYAGEAGMRIPTELAGRDHVCRYTLIDIRTLDSEPLLNSVLPADHVIAILTRLRDRPPPSCTTSWTTKSLVPLSGKASNKACSRKAIHRRTGRPFPSRTRRAKYG
jgi:hypothetical protein